MKLVIDMNLSPRWVEALAAGGFEATHWSVVGDPRAPDVEIFAWARANDSVVMAHDLDFGRLLALSGASGPSVVQIRTHRVLPSDIGHLVIAALKEHHESLARGAIVVIAADASRVRLLPLAATDD
ncbi:MAG TPA: DUF5615 family PIN-like protein [Thermoanaerobaculia bacterium]|nr:DUF5615 family PIN-like protein [Thermoanaerobaculia bacterium]